MRQSRRKSSGACFGRLKSSAPDTGNIEVLWHYGTPEQQDRWLRPLMEGGSVPFSMTERAVASSDATNIQCDIRRDGRHYVINGRKWFTSGAMNVDCIAAC